MNKSSFWGLVSEVFELGDGAYEAKIVFADPAWTPESLGETQAEVFDDFGDTQMVVVRDAAPAFSSYDETDEERSTRLRTAILDSTFCAKFFLIESSSSLPETPFPIGLGEEIKITKTQIELSVPDTRLSEVGACDQAISRISQYAQSKEVKELLQKVAEDSFLSQAQVIPVSWGTQKSSKGIFVRSEPSLLYSSSESESPRGNIYILETSMTMS